ncbi:N2227-domain-containing protein [Pholiota conissans]|uniref:carnosine N-methyltransferase n=1 Tax=Pholiota conissans TaxID=109636 RepID=A0A9P6D583_9AGAR|nr:N2227-domain-containing protein [Pholiota conissans]
MPPPSAEDMLEEQRVFADVIRTFNNYAQYSLAANNRRRKDVYLLPKADQDLLNTLGYKQKLDDVDKAILANADFLSEIVSDTKIFGVEMEEEVEGRDLEHAHGGAHSHSHDAGSSHSSHSHSHSHSHGPHGRASTKQEGKSRPTEFDMDKLRSTMKQLVRDWSEEGLPEREAAYQPMKDALDKHFSHIPQAERIQLKVLVPGSGLGRLAYDVAKMGYTCRGNEFSHYMLLTSYFVLNKTTEIKSHTFYPYVHSFSNAPNKESILQAISIPDVSPSDLPPGSDFSLVAGDFEEIFGDPEGAEDGEWDAVMTCFFIDTAKNIVNYLRILHRILAPGGVWINLGPLLWHWENNNTNDLSVELDLEEVKALARSVGFEISNETTIPTTYTNNAKSMLGYVYNASFWTATKIANPA